MSIQKNKSKIELEITKLWAQEHPIEYFESVRKFHAEAKDMGLKIIHKDTSSDEKVIYKADFA